MYAGVYKFTTAHGDRYEYSIRAADGKQHWHRCETLKQARDGKQDSNGAVRRGTWIDPTDRVTVAEFARLYVENRAHDQRSTTQDRQVGIVAHHVVGTALGALPISRIKRSDVDRWLAEQTVARSTLLTHASLLRSVFAYAVADGRMISAPPVRLQRGTTTRDIHPVMPEQARRLADAMPTPTERTMVLVQAGCGLRISELLGLRRCDVALDFHRLAVEGQLSKDSQRRLPYTETITSSRKVPTTPEVEFTSRTGRPFCRQSYGATFHRAVERAVLDPSTSPHDLRHGFAVALRRQGVSSYIVGRLLGHTDGQMVESVYSSWLPDDDDLALEALSRAWSTTTSTTTTPALRAVK